MKTFLFLLLLVFACSSAALVKHSVGVATDKNNETQYVEHHQYFEDGKHLVRYYDPGMNLLLEKSLDYSIANLPPALSQSDFRQNQEISIQANLDQTELLHRKGSELFTYSLSDELVVDAGFDAFIRNNWDRLKNSQTFKLIVAGREKPFDVRISPVVENDSETVFAIEARNWLLRLVLPQMRLHYDQNKQLIRYSGLSNLKLPGSSTVNVDIEFSHYTLQRALEQPLPEWITSN